LDALPRDDAAELIFNQAVVLQNAGKLQEALALFEQARVAFRTAGKADLELQALSEIRADACGRRDGEVARGGE
jgi:hypothetical protein